VGDTEWQITLSENVYFKHRSIYCVVCLKAQKCEDKKSMFSVQSLESDVVGSQFMLRCGIKKKYVSHSANKSSSNYNLEGAQFISRPHASCKCPSRRTPTSLHRSRICTVFICDGNDVSNWCRFQRIDPKINHR